MFALRQERADRQAVRQESSPHHCISRLLGHMFYFFARPHKLAGLAIGSAFDPGGYRLFCCRLYDAIEIYEMGTFI